MTLLLAWRMVLAYAFRTPDTPNLAERRARPSTTKKART